MNAFFAPAVLLMNRFRYLWKFALLASVFAVTCCTFLGEIVWNQWQDIRVASREVDGARAMPALVALLDAVQKHRGVAAAVQGGSRDLVPELEKRKAAVEQAFDAVGDGGGLGIGPDVQRLRTAWENVAAASTTASETFRAYTGVVTGVLALISEVSEKSRLALDSDPAAHTLAGLATDVAPGLAETYGRVRGLGAKSLADGTLQAEEYERLALEMDATDAARAKLEHVAEAMSTGHPRFHDALAPLVADLGQSREAIGRTLREARDGTAVPSASFFALASKPVDLSYRILDVTLPELNSIMEARMHGLVVGMIARLGFAAVASLIVLYLIAGFYLSVHRSAAELGRAAKAFSGGDFSTRIEVASRDEIADIAREFNAMADGVGTLLHEVRQGVRTLNESVAQLGAASSRVAEGSREQAEAAQSTASAVEEMSVSIANVAENVEETVTTSKRARELSDAGERIVVEAVGEIRMMADAVHASSETIEQLSEHSTRVSGIVRIIRDVADQTNLLALNAAIEAARAGELGRGFAVVADEVRKLAERTAQATTEIASVITNIENGTRSSVEGIRSAGTRVEQGVEQANRAAAALSEIHGGTTVTLDRIAEMAAAAKQQRTASQDIARNVEAIARRAEENSVSVHDIEDASRRVATQASALSALVQKFRTAA
ncbi:MAG: HAMP domain-containing protein [Betaproteobacteria bacterium]|nr:HAMP domain-containing protein [Betaproteobacteria bacterium]